MTVKELLKIPSNKLPLALLLIAVISVTGGLMYLFRGSEQVTKEYKQEVKECRKQLLKLQTDYRNDVQHIYMEVISDLKTSKQIIKSEIKKHFLYMLMYYIHHPPLSHNY